jgi:hypothetical protein
MQEPLAARMAQDLGGEATLRSRRHGASSPDPRRLTAGPFTAFLIILEIMLI